MTLEKAIEEVIPISGSRSEGAASPLPTRTKRVKSIHVQAPLSNSNNSSGNNSGNSGKPTPLQISTTTTPSPTTSPTPTYPSRPQFAIPALPEYPNTDPSNEPEFNGASSTDDSTSNSQAVLLGIQTLERQQEERERKRQQHEMQRRIARANPFETTPPHGFTGLSAGGLRPQDHNGVPMTVHVTDNSDDEITMASDLKTSGVPVALTVSASKKQGRGRINSISKLLKTPLKPIKRSISDRFNIDPTPTRAVAEETDVDPIIFGYLLKRPRNGNNKWQKRWFESDGKSLKYFKSKEKTKALAKLDLERVGSICMDPSDDSDCTFTIEVAGRNYFLCSDTKEKARDWVIALNRVKEARMNIGRLELVYPDGNDSDEDKAPTRMVMNAKHTRARTKKVGKDDFSEMDKSIEEESNSGPVTTMVPSNPSPSAASNSLSSSSPQHQGLTVNTFLNPNAIDVLPRNVKNNVIVGWQKQRSAAQNWGRRLSRWAKRMTQVRCVVKDDVVYVSEINEQRRIEDAKNGEESEEREEPFIDLDIARYSNCPPDLYSEQLPQGNSYTEGLYPPKPTYDFVDNSTANSIQHSSSWKVQNNEPSPSVGGSIQSSSGRISPAVGSSVSPKDASTIT